MTTHPTATPQTRHVRRINPSTWSQAFGYDQGQLRPAPRAVLTVAGQGPIDATGQMRHEGDVPRQLGLTMANVAEVLESGGMDWTDVTRMSVYTTDVDAVLAAYGEIAGPLAVAGATPPATLVGVSRLAVPGMVVEIEVTAAR